MDGLKRYLSFGKRINGDDGEVTVVPSCVTKNCFGHRLPALHMNAITTTRQKGVGSTKRYAIPDSEVCDLRLGRVTVAWIGVSLVCGKGTVEGVAVEEGG